MNFKAYFTEMYANIWQSIDISKFDDYYAKDFEETISVCDENKKPIEINMNYEDLLKQVHWQKENYKNTTIEIRKITATSDGHISVYFYSSSIDKKTQELKHRYVCGIWRLNEHNKINRVWAVVTPYYSN